MSRVRHAGHHMDMPSRLTLRVSVERWPIAGSFAISRGSKTEAVVVVAELGEGKARGRGECVPYARYGETVEGVAAAIEALRPRLEAGLDRAGLQTAMPPGAARNALDCAFWDLEAKLAGRRAYDLAGLPAPRPVTTAYTLSIGSARRRWPCRRGGGGPPPAQGQARPRRRPGAHRRRAPGRAEGGADRRRQRGLGRAQSRGQSRRLRRGRRKPGRTAFARRRATPFWAASHGRSLSAPTKAHMTGPRWRHSPADTTPSTSSSTRPAA